MLFKVHNTNNSRYIECDSTELIIRNEQDILDLITISQENDTTNILIYEGNLSSDFFDLKTNLAGDLFQKFANYSMRGAGIIALRKIKSERFKELIFECNQGNLFRFFEDKEAAEKWLTKVEPEPRIFYKGDNYAHHRPLG